MTKLSLGTRFIPSVFASGLAFLLGSCGDPAPTPAPSDMSVVDLTFVKDTTPPLFGGATTATAALGSITIKWNAASDNSTPPGSIIYQVFQATSSMGQSYATPTATTTGGVTTHTVTGLNANTKYFFVVRAVDAAGNVDSNTTEVSATTPIPDTQAPTFGGVTGATVVGNSINLTWAAAADNNSAAANLVYRVYQATTAGGENYANPTYTTNPGVTSYRVDFLTPNTNYFFVVRAVDEAGNATTNTQERSGMALTPTFAANVQPLLTASCSGCHGGATPSHSLDLSAGKSYAAMVGVNSVDCPTTTKRVVPSQANNSYVVMKINGAGTCFVGGRMPPGANLSAGQTLTITAWINAGALNN